MYLTFSDALRTFFSYLIRKDKSLRPDGCKKIVIMQNAKLGDMICTTPMFRTVKKNIPHARVAVVGNALNKELLAGHPDVDLYIVFDPANPDKTLEEILSFKADFACLCTPDFFGLMLLMKAKISSIAVPLISNGWSPHETKLFRLLRRAVISIPHRMGNYAPGEYLHLLEPIGIYETDTHKSLTYSDDNQKEASKFFARAPVSASVLRIAVAPGAGNKVKQWPTDRFSDVINFLQKEWNAEIFILGSIRDRQEVNQTVAHVIDKKKITNTSEKLSIGGLKALISKMDLVIAADTGSIYIAEAFSVPTLDITGPIDENEQPPRGKMHIIIAPENRKKPELFVMNAKVYDYAEARRQTESVKSQRVKMALQELHPKLLAYHTKIVSKS